MYNMWEIVIVNQLQSFTKELEQLLRVGSVDR